MQLQAKLDKWVSGGLISAEQADAIRAAESDGTVEPSNAAAPRRSGVSLGAEALGYLGSILFVAAVVVAYGDIWDEIEDPIRMAVLGLAVALLVAAGARFRAHSEPALDRMGG